MIIKEFHKKYIIIDIILLIVFIAVYVYLLFFFKSSRASDKYCIFLTTIVIVPSILYDIGFECKKYNINYEGISITWLGIIRVKYKWQTFSVIKIETLESFWGADFEEDSIICSIIPLNKKTSNKIGNREVVDLGWIHMHPYKVVSILLKDLKPGQYEEFWSYVPEGLKT